MNFAELAVRQSLVIFFQTEKNAAMHGLFADITGAEGNSLHVTLDGKDAGLWFDFASLEGGKIPKLLMLRFQMRFPEAVELLEPHPRLQQLRVASPSESAVLAQEQKSPESKLPGSSTARGAPARAHTTSKL